MIIPYGYCSLELSLTMSNNFSRCYLSAKSRRAIDWTKIAGRGNLTSRKWISTQSNENILPHFEYSENAMVYFYNYKIRWDLNSERSLSSQNSVIV